MGVLVLCHYRPGGARERFAMRDVHLRYMIAQRAAIETGGALVGPDEDASGMFLLLACDTVAEAEAFLRPEPYNAAGLFASCSFERASRFIPSDDPRLLETMLEEAEAKADGRQVP